MRFLYGVLFMILIDSMGILTVDQIVYTIKPILNQIFLDLSEATR